MAIKKGDFVEMDFVGKVKDTNEIFDLTIETVAKENNLYNTKFKYKPIIVCIGEGDILKSVEEKLIGKDNGNYKIELTSEESFGKKNTALLKLVPIKIFKKDNLRPFPGLNVNFDGYVGTVRSVSGGRVIVDFNHPLSGKDIVFDIEIKRIIKDDKEKIESLISKLTDKFEIKLNETKLEIKIKLNEEVKKILKEKILKLVPKINEVKFEEIK